MSANTLFSTNPAGGSRFDADVLDGDNFWGFTELSDSDGNDLSVGMMVKIPGMSGWYEIVTIKASVRRIEVEGPDGQLHDVLASEATVL